MNVEILSAEDDIRRMEVEVDKLFRDLMISKNPLGILSETVWRPPTDVYETPEAYVIVMEVAGIRRQDIHISLVDDLLTIRGRRVEHNTDNKIRYHQMEIHHGFFERCISLPDNIDRRNIKDATYSDGFLKIVIPKIEQASDKSSVKVIIRL